MKLDYEKLNYRQKHAKNQVIDVDSSSRRKEVSDILFNQKEVSKLRSAIKKVRAEKKNWKHDFIDNLLKKENP